MESDVNKEREREFLRLSLKNQCSASLREEGLSTKHTGYVLQKTFSSQ